MKLDELKLIFVIAVAVPVRAIFIKDDFDCAQLVCAQRYNMTTVQPFQCALSRVPVTVVFSC